MVKKRISIIIPTYNEKENIFYLIGKIQNHLQKSEYEIIIIDDDSPDATGQEVIKRFAKNIRIRCFIRKGRRSLGRSILYGLRKSRGQIIVGMDADGNHNPEKITEMINCLSENDLVIASRFIEGGGMQNRYRYLASYLMNLLFRIILNSCIKDLTSGYYAVKKEALFTLPLEKIFHGYGDYFIRLIYYAEKKSLLICEKADFFSDRWSGQSKSKLWQMTVDYLLTALKLRLA